MEKMSTHTVTDADVKHRLDFKDFVLSQAEEWHRDHLGRLYEVWDSANRCFFGGRMVVPYILLSVPSSTRALGDCSPVSAFGGRSQIRIRPSIIRGDHPSTRPGPSHAEGRFKFAADILLHEMIHQWQQEVTGRVEKAYKGHGPSFRDKANDIGSALCLPPVRVAKARGKLRTAPSCAHWPHCVRPPDYYLGASTEEFIRPAGERRAVPKPPPWESGAVALDTLMKAARDYHASLSSLGFADAARERLCEAACLFAEHDA
jgi:hypothetical protein